ncbi:MAG: hypothetical protein GEU98_24925 [Pseudonocardiaceae bacterium]|nr:hypothetical protein [Pseudonocardiaceae bacterium]
MFLVVLALLAGTTAMPTSEQAQQLRNLVDRTGTGNLTELGTTEFTGIYYDSRTEGNTVTIAQAEPHNPAVTATALNQAATVALDAPHG